MHSIITGEINSGKTTRLLEKIKNDKTTKYSGWLSLPYFENGSKAGYDIVFIRKSVFAEKKKFMRRKWIPAPRSESGTSFAGMTFSERLRFWMDESIFMDAAEFDFGNPDIFVIDEIGPLELEEKRGFWPLLEGIYKSYDTITVVRKACLDDLLKSFSMHDFQLGTHP